MKNEPIIAYNHLQEEQEQSASGGQAESHAGHNKGWRLMLNPVALVIEIGAIVTMLILMIEEILH